MKKSDFLYLKVCLLCQYIIFKYIQWAMHNPWKSLAVVTPRRKKKTYAPEGKEISRNSRSKVKTGQHIHNTEVRRSQSYTVSKPWIIILRGMLESTEWLVCVSVNCFHSNCYGFFFWEHKPHVLLFLFPDKKSFQNYSWRKWHREANIQQDEKNPNQTNIESC